MKSKPTLVTKDFTKDFYEVIHRFKNDNVLVGIPAEKTQREITDDEENSGMTNAAILAINNFGDPAQNIPKRPVMEIGIRNAQDEIIEIFKACAKDALSRGLAAIRPAYEKAGIVASNSIKKAINSQEGIRKPEDSTIAARKARGFKGNKALIVTGQMRNAITYVVKGKY